ncbi:MAG: hypothetical protein ACOYD7_03490 [Raoultibacter sp.]
MAETRYFGEYARFETSSKKDAAQLMSADNLVGDCYEIVFVAEDGERVAWIKNRFDKMVGFFNSKISRELAFCEARGFTMRAYLSFVAFSDNPKPGFYWGEVALVCYSPKEEALELFAKNIEREITKGNRPKIDLGTQGITQVIDSKGSWIPTKQSPRPKLDGSTAYVKTKRSTTEKLVEQGRAGNKGCSIASWVFLIAIIAVVAYFVLRAFGIF